MTPVFAVVWNLGVPYYNIDECINACRYSSCTEPLSSDCRIKCENDSNIVKMRLYNTCLTTPTADGCSALFWSDYKCPYSFSEKYFDVYKYAKNCTTNCTTSTCKEKCDDKVSKLNSCNECILTGCTTTSNCEDLTSFNYPDNTNEQDCERAKDALGVCRQDAATLGISVSLPVYGKQYALSSLGTGEIYGSLDSEATVLESWSFGSGQNQYSVGTLDCGFYKTSESIPYSKNVKTTTNSSLIADAFFAKMMEKRGNIINTSCKVLIESKLKERVNKLRSVWTASYRPQCLTDLYVRSNLYSSSLDCPSISACTADNETCRTCYCDTWCAADVYSENCMICNNQNPTCLPISQCSNGPTTSSRCKCNCSTWCDTSSSSFNLTYCLACGSSNPCYNYLLCNGDDECRCQCQLEYCVDGSSMSCIKNCESCLSYTNCDGDYNCNCDCTSACAASSVSDDCKKCKCSSSGWNTKTNSCND